MRIFFLLIFFTQLSAYSQSPTIESFTEGFQKKNGLEFDNFEIDKTNLGRLRHELVYRDKSIDLNLLNPSYANLGSNTKSKAIGKYVDLFTENTSTKFQSILDQINYVSSDNEVSRHIENLVLNNIYQPFMSS